MVGFHLGTELCSLLFLDASLLSPWYHTSNLQCTFANEWELRISEVQECELSAGVEIGSLNDV
jgi:hypothetical protein